MKGRKEGERGKEGREGSRHRKKEEGREWWEGEKGRRRKEKEEEKRSRGDKQGRMEEERGWEEIVSHHPPRPGKGGRGNQPPFYWGAKCFQWDESV